MLPVVINKSVVYCVGVEQHGDDADSQLGLHGVHLVITKKSQFCHNLPCFSQREPLAGPGQTVAQHMMTVTACCCSSSE